MSRAPDSERSLFLPLLALCAFLVGTALAIGKPGLPSSLRADEAAYLLQSTSLAVDGDLEIGAGDIERLFALYPYGRGIDVPLRVGNGGGIRVDRPLLYALIAAPAQLIFGVHGPLALNMLLACGAMAFLALYFLRSGATASSAFVLAVAAVALSLVFPYLLWHHPTSLWFFLGSLMLMGLHGRVWALVAGGAWGLLVCSFPSALAVLPALVWRQSAQRARRAENDPRPARAGKKQLGPWIFGAVIGVTIGIGLALAGSSAPFANQVQATHVEAHFDQPRLFDAAALKAGALQKADGALLGKPAEAGVGAWLSTGLIERRRGFLPYFPLVLIPLIGAALAWRQDLLSGADAWRVALFLGLLIHVFFRAAAEHPELGGGWLGDPTQAALYPLFFLLTPRLPRLRWQLPVMAAATLSLGAALVTGLGPATAYGDPQGHTRGGLLSRLPLSPEHIGRAGVYRASELGQFAELDARLWWPAYGGELNGDELWLLGGERVELFLDTAKPISGPHIWRLRNVAPGNVVRVRFSDDSRRLAFPEELPAGGQGAEIEWAESEPFLVEAPDGQTRHIYALRLRSRAGWKPAWQGGEPKTFYLGAALTFLGPKSHLERDVFATEALGCGAPPHLSAGETFQALVRLRNTSTEAWNATGAVRTRLAHRWWATQDGDAQAIQGPRTDLSATVGAGEELSSWVEATAPNAAGAYRLEIDLIYENVAYFSDRRGAPVCTLDIRVD